MQILKGEHLIGHCPANGLVGIGSHGGPPSPIQGWVVRVWEGILTGSFSFSWLTELGRSQSKNTPHTTTTFWQFIMFVFSFEAKTHLLNLPLTSQEPSRLGPVNLLWHTFPRPHSQALVSSPFWTKSTSSISPSFLLSVLVFSSGQKNPLSKRTDEREEGRGRKLDLHFLTWALSV